MKWKNPFKSKPKTRPSFVTLGSSPTILPPRAPSPIVLDDAPTCPNCMRRPVALDTASGKYFDYCTKACAKQARNSTVNRNRGQLDLCEQCMLRPKFKDGDTVHKYCGRTCAKLAGTNGPPPVPSLFTKGSHMTLRPTAPDEICQVSGCELPVSVHQDGTPGDYCPTHEKWRDQGCVSCRVAPMSKASVLCRVCHDGALRKAPIIVKIPEDHQNYSSVETQFKQSWRHSTTCPDVMAVYKIIVSEASLKQYQQYLDGVEANGNFVAMGKSRGNENRRWHGTKRKCLLGDPGQTAFCAEAGCALCCIIKSSFDIKFFKAATGWGRFGHGIYTSSTSSKSNDYSRNLGATSEWKALLLNKVVVGNGKKLVNDDTSLTKPPPGFDSVLAEVAPGGSLNYDELVVYNNDAVRPSYLVMYKSP